MNHQQLISSLLHSLALAAEARQCALRLLERDRRTQAGAMIEAENQERLTIINDHIAELAAQLGAVAREAKAKPE